MGVSDRIIAALRQQKPRAIDVPGLPRAGVLVPIIERAGGPTVLFTRRTETVSHPGQVSFPGGHFEAGEDARRAALREASEEIGLDPSAVSVLGQLDDRFSIGRVIVSPVVGVVAEPPRAFAAQAAEVVEIFEVSLERLLDPRFCREELREVGPVGRGWPPEDMARIPQEWMDLEPDGAHFRIYYYDGGEGRVIWGLTARILRQLLEEAFSAAR